MFLIVCLVTGIIRFWPSHGSQSHSSCFSWLYQVSLGKPSVPDSVFDSYLFLTDSR